MVIGMGLEGTITALCIVLLQGKQELAIGIVYPPFRAHQMQLPSHASLTPPSS